jgi:hypothetical protein
MFLIFEIPPNYKRRNDRNFLDSNIYISKWFPLSTIFYFKNCNSGNLAQRSYLSDYSIHGSEEEVRE